MQINNLGPSNITEAKPAAGAAPIPPVKADPKVIAKPPIAKTDVKPEVKAAEVATAGTKTEITEVEPTGDTNAEGDPTFTLKVNGKEYKATQSEIIALAQKAKGAEAAMKKAAELEKLSSNFLENFDKDHFGLLVKRHGKEKAKEMVIAVMRSIIADEQKTPEQVELEDLRRQNEEHKASQELAKKEQEEAVQKVKQTELYRTMLTEIDAELSKTILPKDKMTLTRVLNFLSAGKKANGQEWSIQDAVQAVEQEEMAHASYYGKQYVDGKLPTERFRAMFGEEAFKKLNKEQIKALKDADKIVKTETTLDSSEVPEVTKKPRSLSRTRGTQAMSEREYRKVHGSLGGI